MRKPRVDLDTPWKDVLDRFFPAFLEFFFLSLYQQVDWSRGYEPLDKELRKITRKAWAGRRVVEKLVKVWLKDGGEVWLLIHIEVQNQEQAEFSERMFIYNYRAFDYFHRKVISLAVLGDPNPRWRPTQYGYDGWGFSMKMQFPIGKLLDYENQWEQLETSSNPFALIVMAHLRTLSTRRKPQSRLEWKIQMVKWLYEQGLPRQQVFDLFRFIDWIMMLPEELDQRFERAVRDYEAGRKMPYLSPFERRTLKRGMQQGMQQGIQQGMQQAARESVLEVLESRFGPVPGKLAATITTLEDTAYLKTLLRTASTAPTLHQFSEAMESLSPLPAGSQNTM